MSETLTITEKGLCITVWIEGDAIQKIEVSLWQDHATDKNSHSAIISNPKTDNPIACWFADYMKGKNPSPALLRINDGKLTDFQRRVFQSLGKVPYGKVISYQNLAISVGGRNYARAVALALSKNPYPIIIPCHRVVPKDFCKNYVGGYSCKNKNEGVLIKRRLLELEGVLD